MELCADVPSARHTAQEQDLDFVESGCNIYCEVLSFPRR